MENESMSFNLHNYGFVEGQLEHPPLITDRSNGKSFRINLKCPDTYETQDEKGQEVQTSQSIEIIGFMAPGCKYQALLESLYDNAEVRVMYSVRNDFKYGKEVRGQRLWLEDIIAIESEASSSSTGPPESTESTAMKIDDDVPF